MQEEVAHPEADGNVHQRCLHQPYSHLLVCESKFDGRNKLKLSSQLCTDLADLQSVGGSCAVQVSVVVHPSGWDASEDCRAYILQQQQQHQQADAQQPEEETGSSHSYGPFEATLERADKRTVNITGLSRGGNLQGVLQQDHPHTLVLQERVPSAASPPQFKLHIQPGSPAQIKNGYSQAISRAGQGKGLQVFPGSVTEVTVTSWTEAVAVSRDAQGRARMAIPRVLMCSQLPAAASNYPLNITLTVLEQQAGAGGTDRRLGQGEEGAKLYHSCDGAVYLQHYSHPLAARAGRRIAKLSLTPHQGSYRLTVTFAPPPAAAAAAAAAAANGGDGGAGSVLLEDATPQPPVPAGAAATATGASAGLSGGVVLSGHRVQAGSPPRAAAVLSGAFAAARTGSGPPAVPPAAASGPQALLLPLKRPAATEELQQPAAAAAAAAARQGAGSEAAAAGHPGTAAATSSKKPRGGRLAKLQQSVSSTPAAAEAAAAAAAGLARSAGGLLLPPREQPAAQPVLAALAQGRGSGGCGSGPAAAAVTAVGPGPVCMKQEPPAEVMDLTADSDEEEQQEGCTPQHNQQQPVPPASEVPPPALLAAAADPATGAAAGSPLLAAPAAAAAAAAAPAAAGAAQPGGPTLLPANLQLPPASGPSSMEKQLTRLMALGLRPLLPSQQYSSLMGRLQQAFGPYREEGDGAGAAGSASTARGRSAQLDQLQVMYLYVQAAVDGRSLCEVVAAVDNLLRAAARLRSPDGPYAGAMGS